VLSIYLSYRDAFVTRLNSSLTQILQSTYLGGNYEDLALAIALSPSGGVYVAGCTRSSDFPNTAGGAQPSWYPAYDYWGGPPLCDSFIARLNDTLTQNLQSTYLGGDGTDYVADLAIHPLTGEVVAAGYTGSSNFPNTAGGAQPSKNVIHDAFVARLSADLTSNPQSTYLGGGGRDWANALAIHPTTGEVYVAGCTGSPDFPGTAGGVQETHGGWDCDAFVSRLNPSLTQLVQSTYLGGNDNDFAIALAIHPTTGEVYVAGLTASTNFPGTAGGAQQTCLVRDAFVARLSADLKQNPQSTYLGGTFNNFGLSGTDHAAALAIHPTTGEVYVAGLADSINFPGTAGGAQARNNGGPDAFVARLKPDLTQILQSTYLGGSAADWANALAIHPATGEVCVAGYTTSGNFPRTAGGAQASYGGFSDAFVARLTRDLWGFRLYLPLVLRMQ
jgi:hypothetical protein